MPHRRRAARWIGRHAGAIVFAAICYLLVLTAGSLLLAASVRAADQPTILVIGSGARLSLLVSAGSSHVLIATGDDGSAFMSAMSDARGMLDRRIDVAVVAGREADLPVANRVVRDLVPRRTLMLAGPLVSRLSELPRRDVSLVSGRTQIDLPDGVRITIEPTGSDPAAPSGDFMASITKGGSTVRIMSEPSSPREATGLGEVLVLTQKADLSDLAAVAAAAIVLPSAVGSPSEISALWAESDAAPTWLIRVSATGSARLHLSSDGVGLPSTAVRVR